MFTDPDLLILDEPTRGIDVGAKYEIYGIIQRLADQGKGVIVISSELPELIGLCDRIYTVFEGAITGEIAGATPPGNPHEADDLDEEDGRDTMSRSRRTFRRTCSEAPPPTLASSE